jgi:serine/threonine-protein kinase
MLGGEPPFWGATRVAVLARQLAGVVPPLRTLRPDVPPGVERAVLRALAKQPEERYATAAEMVAALLVV